MGKNWKTMCLALAVLLMIGLVLQKAWRVYVNKQELTRQAEDLELKVQSLGKEEAELQRNLAKWYNYNLDLGTPVQELPYESILDFGQGRMAVLGVPEWNLQMPIYHSGGGTVSHDRTSSLPIGGRGNHTVLRLTDPYPWRQGMSLYIDCLGRQLIYRVESVQVMGAGWSVERPGEGGQDLMTLVYDRGHTRTLVRCVRCDELVLREGKTGKTIWFAVPAVLLSALIFLPIWRRRRYAFGVQRRRNYGFFRKNRGKTKLL